MRADQDAFGQGVYNFYQGEPYVEIVERDDSYLGVSGGPVVYFAPVTEWSSNKKAVLLRVRYKKMIGPWFEYLMVSPEEMAEIVDGTGWNIGQIVWREDGVDYTAVLQKSAE